MENERYNFCPKCGSKLEENQNFCPNCGNKTNVDEVIEDNTNVEKNEEKADTIVKTKKRKSIITIVIIIVVLALLVFGIYKILDVNHVFATYEDWILMGDYIKAYEKSNDTEKIDIARENMIAHICNDVIDSLKDPSSFELRDAWYNEGDKRIVLEIGAKNSYGGIISNYWYYIANEDSNNEYELYTTISDFDSDKVYSWDSSSERLEKLAKNLAKISIKSEVEKDENKLSDRSIENINYLFKNNLLKSIELIQISGSGEAI